METMKFGGEHLGFKNRGTYVWKSYHEVYLAAKLLPSSQKFITG